MMRVLDLFSGIGGFSLGLERAGMKTVAFCEIDPFCRRVLAKHWPDVPCHEDITKLRGEDVGSVDVICGGFPCQDVSSAGQRAGINGAKSGLWFEYARIIGELRPSYVIVENVAGLLARGMGDVLGELATLGYDAEWHCIPAAAVGAPHRRDRVWIVAYAKRQRRKTKQGSREKIVRWQADNSIRDSEIISDAIARQLRQQSGRRHGANGTSEAQPGEHGQNGHVADAESIRGNGERQTQPSIQSSPGGCSGRSNAWEIEPDVGRVADGVPSRTHRLRALGNAVVPQIPELIGRAIMEVEA